MFVLILHSAKQRSRRLRYVCPQVDPHARKPPHPVAPPASSPALLLPRDASRPKTLPSFPASPRIFASAKHGRRARSLRHTHRSASPHTKQPAPRYRGGHNGGASIALSRVGSIAGLRLLSAKARDSVTQPPIWPLALKLNHLGSGVVRHLTPPPSTLASR